MKHCDDIGIPADKSSTLFLFLGIFATLGRFGGGFLCNMRFIKVRLLQQSATFIVGSSTMLLILAKTYVGMVVYVIPFGFADGIMVTSIIIEFIESVEESKRASAFGFFFMLVGGIVGITSPPLAGSLGLITICYVLILSLNHSAGNQSNPCIFPFMHPLYPSTHPSLPLYLVPSPVPCSVGRSVGFRLSFSSSICVHRPPPPPPPPLHQFQFPYLPSSNVLNILE